MLKKSVKSKLPIWIVTSLSGWLFFWLFPWQNLAAVNIWLKVGISLAFFIIPGSFLFGILNDGRLELLNMVSFGFVLSHLLIAVLGSFGRLSHLPFYVIKFAFMLLGMVFFLIYSILKINQLRGSRIISPDYRRVLQAWPLILISCLTILMSLQRIIADDDLSYLALLTKFQHSPSLDFNDVFLGSENLIAPRFWFVSAPFSQALLAEISGLHGVFWIGGFYEPFLVVISVICFYKLGRSLGLSNRQATASIVFQIVFLALLSDYLSPGSPFFTQLSSDKATASFIFFPVFIQAVMQILEFPSIKNFLLCLFIGLSLSLMHAVTLAFSLIVVAIIVLFRFKLSSFFKYIPLLLIVLIILVPQIVVRFANPDTQGSIAYEINNVDSARGNESLFTALGDTIFYGFNPSILAMGVPYQSTSPIPEVIGKWGWILIPIFSAMFGYRQLRKNKVAQYVCAGFLLCAFAVIPFTGWLLGAFVSARMLARTTWLYPYGIGMVFFLLSVRKTTFLERRFDKWIQRPKKETKPAFIDLPLTFITIFSTTLILIVMKYQNLPNFDRLHSNTQRYQEYANIGGFLDLRIKDQAFVIGTMELNDLIPGLSEKANVINFRISNPLHSYFYTEKEREERYAHQQLMLSNMIPPEERLVLIEKYNIQYILIKAGEYHQVKKLVETYPAKFNIFKIDRYILLEVIM